MKTPGDLHHMNDRVLSTILDVMCKYPAMRWTRRELVDCFGSLGVSKKATEDTISFMLETGMLERTYAVQEVLGMRKKRETGVSLTQKAKDAWQKAGEMLKNKTPTDLRRPGS